MARNPGQPQQQSATRTHRTRKRAWLHQKYITTNVSLNSYFENEHAGSKAATLAAAASIFAHQHFLWGQLQHKTKTHIFSM
jgi:hypothetical protein